MESIVSKCASRIIVFRGNACFVRYTDALTLGMRHSEDSRLLFLGFTISQSEILLQIEVRPSPMVSSDSSQVYYET